MAELAALVQPDSVKIGTACEDKDDPLFKATFITITTSAFAVYVSVSHLTWGGATYHGLLGALGSDAPPPHLIAERERYTGALRENASKILPAWWSVLVGIAGKLLIRRPLGMLSPYTDGVGLPAVAVRAWELNAV